MKMYEHVRILIACISVFCLGGRAIAQTTTGVAPSAADSNSSTAYFGASERFKSYEPNYGIWRFIEGDEDDDALTAHYSFRYDFRGGPGVNLYLAYTGEFDFYMGTRESAPVINRLNNPAIHLRSSKDRKFDWKNLQRDLTTQLGVAAPVDLAHASAADQFAYFIRADDSTDHAGLPPE